MTATIPETTALVLAEEAGSVELGTLHFRRPQELVTRATEIADVLAGIVAQKRLYKGISGRRYVLVDGWTTLAAMLGVTPHEAQVVQENGVYTATIELRRIADGGVIGRASAECGGPEDGVWTKRSPNARRSMALTRATGKACRLAFSWIMVLAGYEATPAEEMPQGEDMPEPDDDSPTATTPWPNDGKLKGKVLGQWTEKALLWLCEPDRQAGTHTAAWQGLAREELKRRALEKASA